MFRHPFLLILSLFLLAACAQPDAVSDISSADHAAAEKRVLIVMSAATSIPLTNGNSHPTGYFLRELTDPLQALVDAGYVIDFTSPGGIKPQVDPDSTRSLWYTYPYLFGSRGRAASALQFAYSFPELNPDASATPLNLDALDATDLQKYAGVFIPGGHAPMADLARSAAMGRVLRYFHEAQKPTALICHAPIALLSAYDENGWIYDGYKMTAISYKGERLLETNGTINGRLTEYVDLEVEKAGAVLRQNPIPGGPKTVQDRELITGQNPFSAPSFGRKFVRALNKYLTRQAAEVDTSVESLPMGIQALKTMNQAELEALFASGSAEEIPDGEAQGYPILMAENSSLNSLASLVWSGKTFHRARGDLLNRVFGMNLIRAKVYRGYIADELARDDSIAAIPPFRSVSIDGKPSIILNYNVSEFFVTRSIVDEIRKVTVNGSENLYLGRATVNGKFWCYFVLQF